MIRDKLRVVLMIGATIALLTLSAAGTLSQTVAGKNTYVGDIMIAEDGKVLPAWAPIKIVDNVYVLKKDVDGTIRIMASNMVLDGGGYSLVDIDATDDDFGIEMDGVHDVVIKNLEVRGFTVGIDVIQCMNFTVSGCYFEGNGHCLQVLQSFGTTIVGTTMIDTAWWAVAIMLGGGADVVCDNVIIGAGTGIHANSQQITIERNELRRCTYGIDLHASFDSWNNLISQNEISCGPYSIGIMIGGVYDSVIENNNFHTNGYGVYAFGAIRCEIRGNSIDNSEIGVLLENSFECRIFGNDFVRNDIQAASERGSEGNLWDDGSRGNYWSDYDGLDLDEDGIGDTPYVISEYEADRYPLMSPVTE